MLSKEEFVSKAFAVAADMSGESVWSAHICAVDQRFIRFKNGKNVDTACLGRMWPELLRVELDTTNANPVIMAATKGQPCVNVPMREIARRILSGLA